MATSQISGFIFLFLFIFLWRVCACIVDIIVDVYVALQLHQDSGSHLFYCTCRRECVMLEGKLFIKLSKYYLNHEYLTVWFYALHSQNFVSKHKKSESHCFVASFNNLVILSLFDFIVCFGVALVHCDVYKLQHLAVLQFLFNILSD